MKLSVSEVRDIARRAINEARPQRKRRSPRKKDGSEAARLEKDYPSAVAYARSEQERAERYGDDPRSSFTSWASTRASKNPIFHLEKIVLYKMRTDNGTDMSFSKIGRYVGPVTNALVGGEYGGQSPILSAFEENDDDLYDAMVQVGLLR